MTIAKSLFDVTVFAVIVGAFPAQATQIDQSSFSPFATVINFDNLVGGNSISTGEVVTNQYAAEGVIFNDPNYPARANASISSLLVTGHSQPNILFVQQHDGGSGQPLQILFTTAEAEVGFFFETSLNSDIELTAYDASNNVLEHDTSVGTNLYDSTLQGFTGIFNSQGIMRLDVASYLNGQPTTPLNFGIDDLTFQLTPEPSALALAGLGGAALMVLRRRKRGSH